MKFGVNQTNYRTAKLSPLDVSASVSGSTRGFSTLTGATNSDDPTKSFDLPDDLAWIHGKRSLKVGF